MRTRFIIALLASAVSLSSVSAAQSSAPQDADARRASYLAGDRAIAAKDWPTAETIFKKLWAEGATYDVALSLGQAEFRQNKYRDAAQHFTFAIANYPPREKTDTLQRTKQFLNSAAKHIGTLHITVDQPGAEVRVDDEPIGTSPLPASAYVDAGTHTVEARLADHVPTKQEITITAGRDLNVALQFTGPVLLSGMDGMDGPGATAPPVTSELDAHGTAATSVNPPPIDASERSIETRPIALWTGVGVTAVSLGLAVGFALKARSAEEDAKRYRVNLQPGDCFSLGGPFSCIELRQSLEDHNSSIKTANISVAVAGVASVATAAMFILWPSRRTEGASELRLAPTATQNTGGMVVSGKF